MGIFSRKKKDDDKKKEPKKKAATSATPVVQDEEVTTPTVTLPKTDDATAYQVIISPHVTEKGNVLAGHNQYVFKVAKSANKIMIKRAIETLYKVTVIDVQIVNLPAKRRRLGRSVGKRSGFKKAIVRLKDGDRIDMTA